MSVFIPPKKKNFYWGYLSFLLRFYNIPFHPLKMFCGGGGGGKVNLSSVLFFRRCFLAPFPSVIAGWGEGMGEKRWGGRDEGEEVGDINGKEGWGKGWGRRDKD